MLPEHSLSQSGRPRRLSARALACRTAGARMMAAFARFQALAEKAGFNPDQPRVPAGNPDGGKWTGSDGATGGRQPGIGDNGGPSLDPSEPRKEPSKDKASRTQAAKALARQALRRAGPVGAAIMAIEAGHQLYSELPSIRSYLDEPKTLDELQQNVGRKRPGYEDHHIVERGAGGSESFSRAQIEGVGNVVSVPKYRHHEITGWYSKKNPQFGGLSPRQYLQGRSWAEQVQMGHYALRRFGVLK